MQRNMARTNPIISQYHSGEQRTARQSEISSKLKTNIAILVEDQYISQ